MSVLVNTECWRLEPLADHSVELSQPPRSLTRFQITDGDNSGQYPAIALFGTPRLMFYRLFSLGRMACL